VLLLLLLLHSRQHYRPSQAGALGAVPEVRQQRAVARLHLPTRWRQLR
jgi:hypothetical protein